MQITGYSKFCMYTHPVNSKLYLTPGRISFRTNCHMRNMALVLDKRIFHALNNYLCEEKKILFGVLKVKSCNATLSVPFSKAECKYDGYWDDTTGISEMCAISFQTIFDKGVSLLKMIEDAGEDGWTDEIDDHTKSALIRLNEYLENKGAYSIQFNSVN